MSLPGPPILRGPISSEVSWAGGAFSGAELAARVHTAASRIPPGSRVAVDASDAVTGLCWFLGSDVSGSAALLLEPTWSTRERRSVLADARPAVVVGGPLEPGSTAVEPVGTESTRFYLPTTSGSSGRPRVLVRSRRSWLRSFDVFDLGTRPDDRVLVPGPLSSSLFLFAAVHALHEGLDLHLLERWSAAEAAEACRRATVLHAVPSMLAALLAGWEEDPLLRRECALRQVVCGGARVDRGVEERLFRLLPGCELVEYYGSAEQSLVAMRRGEALRPVAEVEVRDERGAALPPGRLGRLWVRSELLFDGYLDAGEPSAPADWTDGWSSVGDQAVVHGDGTLAVHGRSSATISTGGRLVAAEEVESVLRGAPGVRDVLVAATPHPRLGSLVTAVIETDAARPPGLRDLRALARAELEPAKRPRRWLATTELPRTPAGKPARGLVTERLRTGALVGEPLA